MWCKWLYFWKAQRYGGRRIVSKTDSCSTKWRRRRSELPSHRLGVAHTTVSRAIQRFRETNTDSRRLGQRRHNALQHTVLVASQTTFCSLQCSCYLHTNGSATGRILGLILLENMWIVKTTINCQRPKVLNKEYIAFVGPLCVKSNWLEIFRKNCLQQSRSFTNFQKIDTSVFVGVENLKKI